MSTTIAEAAHSYAIALAEFVFEPSASWRRLKAEEFPEDARNVRCATALEAATAYVRALEHPEENEGIRRLVDLADQLEMWRRPGRDPEVILVSSSNAAGRFCFDNVSREPTPADFDRLILAVFTETLESWRESIEQGIDQPPGDLVRFFDEHGVPLWEHDDENEADVRFVLSAEEIAANGPLDLDEMKERIQEFVKEARTIADRGTEALDCLISGSQQGACNVVAIAHYPMGHVRNCYDGILETFAAHGVEPTS